MPVEPSGEDGRTKIGMTEIAGKENATSILIEAPTPARKDMRFHDR